MIIYMIHNQEEKSVPYMQISQVWN